MMRKQCENCQEYFEANQNYKKLCPHCNDSHNLFIKRKTELGLDKVKLIDLHQGDIIKFGDSTVEIIRKNRNDVVLKVGRKEEIQLSNHFLEKMYPNGFTLVERPEFEIASVSFTGDSTVPHMSKMDLEALFDLSFESSKVYKLTLEVLKEKWDD